MPELAIIADDLTGALDAAAPFAMRGIHAVVALSADALPEAIATGAAVVGVSTDSREVSEEQARENTRTAVAALPPGTRLFKKVDSRLKGNIAAELDNPGALTVDAPTTLGRPSAHHTSAGTIAVAGGNLTVNQSGTAPGFATSGTITVAAGRTFIISGGALNYDAGSLGGSGTLSLQSATETLSPNHWCASSCAITQEASPPGSKKPSE